MNDVSFLKKNPLKFGNWSTRATIRFGLNLPETKIYSFKKDWMSFSLEIIEQFQIVRYVVF